MAKITYSLIHKRDPRSGGGQTVRADTEPPPTPDDPTNYDYIADVIQDGTVVPGALAPRDANPSGAVVYVAGTNSLRQATVQEQRDHATNEVTDKHEGRRASAKAALEAAGTINVTRALVRLLRRIQVANRAADPALPDITVAQMVGFLKNELDAE